MYTTVNNRLLYCVLHILCMNLSAFKCKVCGYETESREGFSLHIKHHTIPEMIATSLFHEIDNLE